MSAPRGGARTSGRKFSHPFRVPNSFFDGFQWFATTGYCLAAFQAAKLRTARQNTQQPTALKRGASCRAVYERSLRQPTADAGGNGRRRWLINGRELFNVGPAFAVFPVQSD